MIGLFLLNTIIQKKNSKTKIHGKTKMIYSLRFFFRLKLPCLNININQNDCLLSFDKTVFQYGKIPLQASF